MEIYFAPLEGITLAAFRRVHSSLFPGTDAWFTPFIAPDSEGSYRGKILREILPENNPGIRLIPQLLVSRPEPFLLAAEAFRELGYSEVNLNTGCPSGTVFAKHKGAGMLADLPALDVFLDRVFSETDLNISIKTRMGIASTEEFPGIMDVFRKYPLQMLIVHARHREGYYESSPDISGFAAAAADAPFPVCYNGNIFSPADLKALKEKVPVLTLLMAGRGAVADPALIRRLKGGADLSLEELQTFHDTLLETLRVEGLAPNHTLSHMKELWYYWIHLFTGCGKLYKRLKKAPRLSEYNAVAEEIFRSGCFDASRSFSGGRYEE